MRDRPRSSNLLLLIGVTGVVAAAAVESAGAVRGGSRTGGKEPASACPPAVSARHLTVSLDLRCPRGSSRTAAGPPGKAAS